MSGYMDGGFTDDSWTDRRRADGGVLGRVSGSVNGADG